jgi:hypothetical protein
VDRREFVCAYCGQHNSLELTGDKILACMCCGGHVGKTMLTEFAGVQQEMPVGVGFGAVVMTCCSPTIRLMSMPFEEAMGGT